MNDSFYRDFEDRFRGTRGLIKSRLHVYLPFIRPLAVHYPSAKALDLGCGRGEWLELLGENGFDALGVDLDEGMLAACHELGLNARQADALKTLQALSAGSVALVSAFHVVEHLPFDTVRALVREALRVLKPGGLLILETPNPENLAVGASSFYLDPSHIRPLPPALLVFVAEHAGFCRSKAMCLQESAELHTRAAIGLISVLNGVSPDYAVVAQKTAASGMLSGFDEPFHTDYGFSLETLAQRYDSQAENRATQLEEQLTKASNRLAQVENGITDRLARVENGIAPITDRLARMENGIAPIADRLTLVEVQLHGMLNSRSWRVTAPLRWLAGVARSARQRAAKIFRH